MDINKRPPLPFQGNKRNSITKLYEMFKDDVIDDDCVILDLFGGSGLLADLYKKMYPNNEVIWNDFDNYQSRLDNIENTNLILDQIKTKFDFENTRGQKVDGLSKIVEDVTKEVGDDIDLLTISSWTQLCSMKGKKKYGNYNKLPKNSYKLPENYLGGGKSCKYGF